MQADHDIFEQGHFLEDTDVLKGPRNAHARDLVRLAAGQVVALKVNPATGWWQQAGDQVEDRGLACAVRTNQAEDTALGYF